MTPFNKEPQVRTLPKLAFTGAALTATLAIPSTTITTHNPSRTVVVQDAAAAFQPPATATPTTPAPGVATSTTNKPSLVAPKPVDEIADHSDHTENLRASRSKTREATEKLRESLRPTTTPPPPRPSGCGNGPLPGRTREEVRQRVVACWGDLIATCPLWSVSRMSYYVARESRGWPRADNPRSSAYGLYQRLHETSSDPAVQTARACELSRNAVRYGWSQYQPWGG